MKIKTYRRTTSALILLGLLTVAGIRCADAQTAEPILAAQAGAATGVAPPAAVAVKQTSQSAGIEEIIVTAQKREERLLDTPQSVSVLSADDLAKLGATQLLDFAYTVPGLDIETTGGNTQITIRGVTAGFDISPTVGIYLDEVPYGSSSAHNLGAQSALDVGLFDIDRIEVLRGPQGTLYGAATMGGLIKYVSKRPDTQNFSVNLSTGVSTTQEGGVGYNVASAANLPIVAGKLALRVSGFGEHGGGYIDNLALGQKDVDSYDIYGGRLDLLFTPTEALSIRIGGFLQDISRDGESTADYSRTGQMPYGSLGQYRKLPEPWDQRFQLVNGTVDYDLGPAKLTSISSYQTALIRNTFDISAVYVPLLQAVLHRSYSAVGDQNYSSTDKFTQEVRVTSEGSHQLDWVIGGFYTHETTSSSGTWILQINGLPAPNNLFSTGNPVRYDEIAGFGDLTWHLTTNFDVTGGLRYSGNSQTVKYNGTGLLTPSHPAAESSEDVVTYLANARYHFSDHATGYFRYATGYRPGGPNFTLISPVTGLPIAPATFEADQLKSYEVGFKSETADSRFGIDVAGYYIDWSNIQITVVRSGFGAIENAPGGAGIRGAELTLTAHPIPDFNMVGTFAYQDAYLKEANADLGAYAGEQLPNVPRLSGSLNADYALFSAWSLRPTVGGTLRYVDNRTASFDNSKSFPQYHLPAYTVLNLRAGFTLGPVITQLYVHNVFDERGQLSLLFPQFGTRVAILEPRTVGLAASMKF